MSLRSAVLLSLSLTACAGAQAAWVDEEFNGPGLGSQWTSFYATTPNATTPGTVSGGQYHLTCAEQTDHFRIPNNYPYIQCDAPTGTNWEVSTLIHNFDPREAGKNAPFNRAGIMLWQDRNHWIWVGLNSNGAGTDRVVACYVQYDPIALPAEESANWVDYFDQVDLGNINTEPLHVKISKTPRGYCTYFSGDGATWQQIGPHIKNPETTDGYFTNEKIQLMCCAPGTAGTPDQADFEYVRKTDLVAPTGGFQNTEFDAPLNDRWTTALGAVTPGTIGVSGGQLNMSMGKWSDEWSHMHESMFAAQDAPLFNSYRLSIKGAPTDLKSAPGVWAAWGMQLWQNQNEKIMVLCTKGDVNTSHGVQVLYWRANPFMLDAYFIDQSSGLLPQYLGVEKTGTNIAAVYSFDNVNWVKVPAAGKEYTSDKMPSPLVRLMGRRLFADEGNHNISFDWVRAIATGPTAVDDWQLLQ